jgi:hypothetical protein
VELLHVKNFLLAAMVELRCVLNVRALRQFLTLTKVETSSAVLAQVVARASVFAISDEQLTAQNRVPAH